MAKWALVFGGKVVDVMDSDPTGLFHEGLKVLTAPDNAYVGQDVDDDGKFISKEAVGVVPAEVEVKDTPVPVLTEEEIEANRVAALAALPEGMDLDLA